MIGSHVIPKFYLEQFARKQRPSAKTGHLWVYSKDSPPRRGTAKSEGVENGYFAMPKPGGAFDETLEHGLAKLEDKANGALVTASSENFAWSLGIRQELGSYVALLWARTKVRQDATNWVVKTARKNLIALLEDEQFLREMTTQWSEMLQYPLDVAILKESIERAAVGMATPHHAKEFFINEILDTQRLISEILLGRPWQIWRSPENVEFITSDSPTVTMFPVGEQFAPGFGFNQKGVLVAFPLNPKTCLVIGRDGGEFTEVDASMVARVNELQVLYMFQNVYSRSRSQVIEAAVRERGGYSKFGENAFLLPGDAVRVALKHFILNEWQKLRRR